MVDLLEKAVAAVRMLPPDDQEEIARLMLNLAGKNDGREEIDPGHLPDVLKSLSQAQSGEFATDAEIEAAFRRFGG